MTDFPVRTIEDAPANSRDTLEQVQQGYGFIPNVVGVMAGSPALVKAYTTLSQLLGETGFSPEEQQVAILSVSYANGCDYCMAAHSMSAEKTGVDQAVIEALRAGKPLPDERLEALRRFVQTLVEKRGWADEDDIQAFVDAGFERERVLDCILAVGMKTLSNYTNHIAETPLDDVFAGKEWRKAG